MVGKEFWEGSGGDTRMIFAFSMSVHGVVIQLGSGADTLTLHEVIGTKKGSLDWICFLCNPLHLQTLKVVRTFQMSFHIQVCHSRGKSRKNSEFGC